MGKDSTFGQGIVSPTAGRRVSHCYGFVPILIESTGIGLSGMIGAGIFVTSGALVSTVGSLGAAVSYLVAGGIVACVCYTITEMLSARPLTGALIDFPHTFLDPAFGFAVGASYAYAESKFIEFVPG